MTTGLSNDRTSPGTSLQLNGAAVQGESVHEAETTDHFDPLPNGDGGGIQYEIYPEYYLWTDQKVGYYSHAFTSIYYSNIVII